MRITSLLLVIGAMHVSATSLSQTVTLHVKDQSLRKIFNTIEKQTELLIFYKNRLINPSRKASVQAADRPLDEVLQTLLNPMDLTYRIHENTIVITERREQRNPSNVAETQQRRLMGRVTGDQGKPLAGVTVQLKGSTVAVTTDENGNYQIDIPNDGRILVFSIIGFEPTERSVGDQAVMNVSMKAAVSDLDEVVVVGYGTQKKSDLTGAVSSVDADELTRYPASSAIQGLQGRAAGVTVQSTNGAPGGQYKIRIRGATSINASSDPLIVVDGLVGGTMPPPEDIASMEVLKDASASAIYGSRGANGVVIVTTKSGSTGKVEVNVNTYYAKQREIGRLDVLNAQEFVEYINDARGYAFFNPDSVTTDTDWQDLVFQSGYLQNHQVSVAGGGEKAQYYVSGIFHDQKGVIKTSGFKRYSLTTNLNFDLSDHVRLNLSSNFRSAKNDNIRTQTGGGVLNSGPVTAAQRFDPNQGILDENGQYTKSLVGIAAYDNPYSTIYGREAEAVRDEFQANLKAQVDITEGLVFNSTFGTIIRNARNGSYANRISNQGEGNNGLANMGYNKHVNFLTEQYLNYELAVAEKHDLVFTGGYSYQLFQNESFSASNAGFLTDALGFWNLGVGTNLQIPASGYSGSKIASFYGRVNYNFDERYLLTLSSRYDGASQFAKGNQWSFFPSGAFSWNVHNEKFWPTASLLSSLKLRLSYGLTGNQAIGPYQSLARISNSFFVLNGASVSSVRPSSIANRDLTWETTAQSNVGLDIGLVNSRILFSGDYYYKKTSDLLFSVPVPAFSGYQTRLENLGSIENKGVEFQVESRNLVNAFTWTTNFNVSFNRNKVLDLPGGVDIFYSTAPSANGGTMQTSLLREGEPVGVFYGFVYDGVYQEGDTFIPGGGFETTPGGEKFADLDGNNVLDNDDRAVIGDPNPKAVWGLSNDFSYRGFYFSVFFQAYTGGDMLNLVKLDMDRLSGNTNATRDALRRWTPQRTDTDVPKAAAGRTSRVSSRFVEDGSFVRLKNLSFGYNFDQGWLKRWRINRARIYVSAQNLLTFSNYSGVDPEVAYRSSNVNMGLDFDSYPNTTSYTFGLTLGF